MSKRSNLRTFILAVVAVFLTAAVVTGCDGNEAENADDPLRKGNAAFEAKDYENAAKYYSTAAEQGNVEALFKLGYCFGAGKGVKPNKEEALKLYTMAAEGGHAEAQYTLGLCYDGTLTFVDGDDVDQFVETDMEEALKWYRKAGTQGHGLAEHMANALEVILKGKNKNRK